MAARGSIITAGLSELARIFISHSSANNAEAVAVQEWLVANGWDDLFLDLDPMRGIKAGERWQAALKQAAERCEVVIFLVSPAWRASEWCVAEFLLAKQMNKRIVGVIVDPIPLEDLPTEMTAEWQLVDLTDGRRTYKTTVTVPPSGVSITVKFSGNGLDRLKIGLTEAGLDARFFAWPPESDPGRSPYRGLLPLEAEDAGIFYGRDGSIVTGIDLLRGLIDAAPPRIMVILGASGAGKSSFMRAGLLPRLAREDHHFRPLPVIRPERAVVSGETGLIACLESAFQSSETPMSRADIRTAVAGGADTLRPLLETLAQSGARDSRRPTLLLPIDQGEELFHADGFDEASAFLGILRDLTETDQPALAAIFTIRSENFEALQSAPELEGIRKVPFDLPPMPRGSYAEVINGPARRLQGTPRELVIEEPLVDAILRDIESGGAKDALPLLAFTLERLYREYGGDGDLKLSEYEDLGRVRGSIEAAVERAMRAADADPRVPREEGARLALLRRGLIPWLAGIDPESGAPRRRVARMSEIPEEARPIMEALVGQRLLATDVASDSGETTIEPAHEALLRQWSLLGDWLDEDFEDLTVLEGVKRAVRDWEANARDPEWLTHTGARLEQAEAVASRADFADHVSQAERDYLKKARETEDATARAEAARAKRERRTKALVTFGSAAAAVIVFVLGWLMYDQFREAEAQRREAEAGKLSADAIFAMGDGNHVKAIQLFEKSAELGSTSSVIMLGAILMEGVGGEKDFAKAQFWLEKGAKAGSDVAMSGLGRVFRIGGHGVEQNYEKAREWYEKAAEYENAAAILQLGHFYANGLTVEKDPVKARAFYERAAAKGNAEAMFNLGLIYADGNGVDKDLRQTVHWYEKAVEKGDPAAMNNLGLIFQNGQGVKQDLSRARSLFESAAKKNNSLGMFNLGLMYRFGTGVPRDDNQARAWFRKAADLENSGAMYELGSLYAYGMGVQRSFPVAREWFEKAAAKGHLQAMTDLGQIHAKGLGVPRSTAKAKEWLNKAIEKGFADAMREMALIYRYGQGVPKDMAKAIEWLKKAAEKGSTSAMTDLGWIFYSAEGVEQDVSAARNWFKLGADSGHGMAMDGLGVTFNGGRGIEPDYPSAVSWFRKAAQRGVASSMYSLGLAYNAGRGVKQDLSTAFEWYEKAAAKGYAAAMNSLAVAFERGEGVKKDAIKAREWYEKSAGRGSVIAMYNLGLMYRHGRGGEKNHLTAFRWFEGAALKGDLRAMGMLGIIYDNGTGIRQNHQKAREWYSKAAAKGDAVSMANLGRIYNEGLGVERNYQTARKWFEQAAAKGVPEAMRYLGRLYGYGHGVKQDFAESRKWLEMAAEKGDADSLQHLGWMHAEGKGGLQKDFKKARSLYERAAAKGNLHAMRNLGLLILNGRGGEKNDAKAKEWFEKAANQGDLNSMLELGSLLSRGGPDVRDLKAARIWYERADKRGNTRAEWELRLFRINEEYSAGRYESAFKLQTDYLALAEASDIENGGKTSTRTRRAIAVLPWYAIAARKFRESVAASDRAVALSPDNLNAKLNRAHALMFAGRPDDARSIYMAHRGKTMSTIGDKLWEVVAVGDFELLRKAGLSHPLMDEMEKLLRSTIPASGAY